MTNTDKVPEYDDKYELHRLLSTLFSMELFLDEKIGIMEKEYSIAADDEMREDVGAMCNLSQGIMEKGMEKGHGKRQREKGRRNYPEYAKE